MSATPYIGCGVGHHSEKTQEEKNFRKKTQEKKTICEKMKRTYLDRLFCLRVNTFC
jgi:hypothetical protein